VGRLGRGRGKFLAAKGGGRGARGETAKRRGTKRLFSFLANDDENGGRKTGGNPRRKTAKNKGEKKKPDAF